MEFALSSTFGQWQIFIKKILICRLIELIFFFYDYINSPQNDFFLSQCLMVSGSITYGRPLNYCGAEMNLNSSGIFSFCSNFLCSIIIFIVITIVVSLLLFHYSGIASNFKR